MKPAEQQPETGFPLMDLIRTCEHPEDLMVLFRGRQSFDGEPESERSYVLIRASWPGGEPLSFSVSDPGHPEEDRLLIEGRWNVGSAQLISMKELLNHGLADLVSHASFQFRCATDETTTKIAENDLLHKLMILFGDRLGAERIEIERLAENNAKLVFSINQEKDKASKARNALVSHLTSWCRLFSWDQEVVNHAVQVFRAAGFLDIPDGFRSIAEGSGAVIDPTAEPTRVIATGGFMSTLPDAVRGARLDKGDLRSALEAATETVQKARAQLRESLGIVSPSAHFVPGAKDTPSFEGVHEVFVDSQGLYHDPLSSDKSSDPEPPADV